VKTEGKNHPIDLNIDQTQTSGLKLFEKIIIEIKTEEFIVNPK
jgi:hypothetical protein